MYWFLLLGVVTGMRTMTAVAVLCWFSYFGAYPPIGETWAVWTTKLVSVIVFTVFALGEYWVDVQPQTPSRKEFRLAAARFVFGGVAGAICAAAIIQPWLGGAILGCIGALIGTFGGYKIRMWLAGLFGRDLPAGLLESAFALVFAIAQCVALHFDSIHSLAFEMR